MATYQIINRVSGATMGTYEGTTASDAIEAMHRDAGHASSEDAADTLGSTVEALRAELVVKEVSIDDDAVRSLRDEAAVAGDLDMVATCDRALKGDDGARARCERAISDARAMAD